MLQRGIAMEGLLVALVVGAIAGWLAGQIMKGSGYGLIGDIIIGVIGGFIGSWLWGVLKLPLIANFWISAIVTATVGAVLLLFVVRLVRR
jgi:uncharacterized membrane protein YeaQ/YmgE (transglycosylase-associated protein family)